ncbi:MAG: N-acetylmuramic acid 6-phosphate etherase [Victivallaceae bacterium]|nr:N-acetylmuramic acid 6-phosphate etherase [Victivallaceae bacterium]
MKNYLAIDIGGTWLKAALYDGTELSATVRVPSRLDTGDVENAVFEAASQLGAESIAGIGVSTAGIVDYAGTKVARSAGHLTPLCRTAWKDAVERKFNAPCVLINDADAAMIAAHRLELVGPGDNCALIAVGTGLGCSVIRGSHRIRPARMLALAGSVRLPDGASYDSIASAVRLGAGRDLAQLFHDNPPELEKYLDDLACVVKTVCILYKLDAAVITGGLAAAAASGGFDLRLALSSRTAEPVPELGTPIRIEVSAKGLPLIGAGLLAEAIAFQGVKLPPNPDSTTERSLFGDLELTDLDSCELARRFSEAECAAGERFAASLPALALAADRAAANFARGGRLIYIGAGTSGRLGAVDAVELPCTYGIEPHRAVALIAGGNDDAALTIESDGEEDASSVPELLLLNLDERDTVIGVSASGGAFFVTSGLNYAKFRGAFTVLIQESPEARTTVDALIPLRSGAEAVAGSTRMKAGTATKKALNFLSTIVMIKLGFTRKSRMINMQTLNEKLRLRAARM